MSRPARQRPSVGDGSLEVRHEEQVAPAAFGRHAVRFYYREQDGERLLAQTMLDDDGADPSERNVAATMVADGTWQVTLMGQQQADERWLVELGAGDPWMRKVGLATDIAGRDVAARAYRVSARAGSAEPDPGP